MFLVTSPIVINVPTRGLLAVETMHAIVRWLANFNIKRNMTSVLVNKKHRYNLVQGTAPVSRQRETCNAKCIDFNLLFTYWYTVL